MIGVHCIINIKQIFCAHSMSFVNINVPVLPYFPPIKGSNLFLKGEREYINTAKTVDVDINVKNNI